MSYCKHCGEELTLLELASKHHCSKMGVLNTLTDGTFIVSTIIGASTGSSTLGSIGGSVFGGVADSVIGGVSSFFTDDDDEDEVDDNDDDWDD